MLSNPSLVDVMTIVSGICLWFSTVIGFVWWLSKKFNDLISANDYYKGHEQLSERVRLIEISIAQISQKVMNNQQAQMDRDNRNENRR